MLNELVRLKYVEVHHLQPLGVVTAEHDGLITFVQQHLRVGRAMVGASDMPKTRWMVGRRRSVTGRTEG